MESFKKVFVEKMKEEGLDVAEEAVSKMVSAMLDAGSMYLMSQKNDFMKMAGGVLPMLKKPLLDLVDKIDGEKDLK